MDLFATPSPAFSGAKLPLRPMHVWAIRVRLEIESRVRDLALFDIALDSKLRGCDIVTLRLADIMTGGAIRRRAMVLQQKTGRPVHFEITEQARRSLGHWLTLRPAEVGGWLFPSRMRPGSPSLHPPIFPVIKALGNANRAAASRLWHPQHAADQGFPTLPQDRQSAGLPVASRSYEAGKHCPLSRS